MVPVIVTGAADSVPFVTEIGHSSTIHVGLRPQARVRYAIEWRQGRVRRVLAQGTVDGPTSISCAYPRGSGVVELVADAPIVWVDPRAVRDLPLVPYVWALGWLMLCWVTWRIRDQAASPGLFLGFSRGLAGCSC